MRNIDDFFNAFEASVDFDSFLGIKFFLCFARFEYALKKSGYLKNQTNAIPDWNSYARAIEEQINSRLHNISESLEYFRDNPTKRQENDSGTVRYVNTSYDNHISLFIWSIRMITRVRNNFFHGGKYRDLVVEDSLRNTYLLRHSLLILNECLELDNEVTSCFKNYQI